MHEGWKRVKGKAWSPAFVGTTVVILIGWPLVELQAWSPYYPFYLNSIGGGTRNITHYFAPDEVAEFDTREVAKQICPFAPSATRLATARPMSMAYYLETCGRTDMQVVPLYDAHYSPRKGDLIMLEPSRRFFETQRYFDALNSSGMTHSNVQLGPVFASTIYLFDPTVPEPKSFQDTLTLSQLGDAPPRFDNDAQHFDAKSTSAGSFAESFRRQIR